MPICKQLSLNRLSVNSSGIPPPLHLLLDFCFLPLGSTAMGGELGAQAEPRVRASIKGQQAEFVYQ